MITITNIVEEIRKRKGFQTVFANTSWVLFERIIQLGIGLLVNILVARYLGPEKYGILSYAFSLIAFLGTFAYLGLSGLVVRDIVRFPDEKNMLLGTTFSLKFAGSFFAFLMAIGLALFTHDIGGNEFWILLIIGLSLFARPFQTIDFWFQSQIQSKYTVLANLTAYVFGAALKTLLVFLSASVIAFACASSLQVILASILLIIIYRYKGFSIFQWQFQISKAKDLLSQSWIIILSGFLALVNEKVDQIMLRWMSGAADVGIYSVAVTFSEVWYFIPTTIAMSVFPKLIDLKKSQASIYNKRLQQVCDVLFTLAFLVALAMSFVAGPLIPFLYTDAYSGASAILIIHVWAGIFIFMRALFSKWILIEDALIFSLISHGAGAAVNVFLNLVLIPRYGGQGAAFATLFSYAAASYFALFFSLKTKPLALIMSKSLVLPLRLIIYRGKTWA